jgi:hypothetical protein
VTSCPAKAGRPQFDIGEIVRAHAVELVRRYPLTVEQRRALTAIGSCRTAALGGHVDQCPSCGYERPSYNSCRNRHCPKCQALAQERWIEQRNAQLLDVGHFHLVFTLPSELRPLARLAPRVVYGALFQAVSETLLELGRTHLKANLGATLVLHTWTRDLRLHPHIHAIVTPGGLALDGSRFVPSENNYLFPIWVMGKRLRGKMLAALSDAYAAGELAHVPAFHDPRAFPTLVATVAKLNWNVYAKAPFATSKHVVAYLGRYTHRVGIANSRLLEVSPHRVVFRTRGDAVATLTPLAFLARFIQHVLPSRFHKIRHIGLYASKTKLEDARNKLGGAPAPSPKPRTAAQMIFDLTGTDIRLCPQCGTALATRKLPRLARAPPRTTTRLAT